MGCTFITGTRPHLHGWLSGHALLLPTLLPSLLSYPPHPYLLPSLLPSLPPSLPSSCRSCIPSLTPLPHSLPPTLPVHHAGHECICRLCQGRALRARLRITGGGEAASAVPATSTHGLGCGRSNRLGWGGGGSSCHAASPPRPPLQPALNPAQAGQARASGRPGKGGGRKLSKHMLVLRRLHHRLFQLLAVCSDVCSALRTLPPPPSLLARFAWAASTGAWAGRQWRT